VYPAHSIAAFSWSARQSASVSEPICTVDRVQEINSIAPAQRNAEKTVFIFAER
jgi:hypothetical protein